MKNRKEFALLFIFGLIVYSIKIFSNTISIDTEIMLNEPNTIMNDWLGIGRFSLVFMKKIFNLVRYSLFLTNLLTYIVFVISIFLWIIFLEKIENKKDKIANFCFGAILITSVTIAEQFNFTLQSLEIALAFLLLPLTFWILEIYLKNHKKIFLVIGVFLTTFIFGCYQSFVVLFITISLFLNIIKQQTKKNDTSIILYGVVFILAFILYFLVGDLVKKICAVPENLYLVENIMWGRMKLSTIIYIIVEHITCILFGIGLENNIAFLFISILFVLQIKNTNRKKIIFYMKLIILFCSPFILTFF